MKATAGRNRRSSSIFPARSSISFAVGLGLFGARSIGTGGWRPPAGAKLRHKKGRRAHRVWPKPRDSARCGGIQKPPRAVTIFARPYRGAMHARLLVACVLLLALSATRTFAVDIFSLPVAGNIRVGRTVSLSGQFSAESADVSAAAGFWLNWVNHQVLLCAVSYTCLIRPRSVA